MDDLISRQAAVDAARKCSVKEVTPDYMLIDKAEIMTELMMLPTAQPEERTEKRTETHACDLISRQAAIDALKRKTFRLTFAEEQNCEGHVAWSADAVYSDVMEGELLELPSVQPELERTMEEFMYGQDMGNPEDGSL